MAFQHSTSQHSLNAAFVGHESSVSISASDRSDRDLELGIGTTTKVSHPEEVQDHKDGLNRYTKVDPKDAEKDHYLCPDDGKLCLLYVQHAPGHDHNSRLISTWSEPPLQNPFKLGWKRFRNVPKQTLGWTYNDWAKNNSDSMENDEQGEKRKLTSAWGTSSQHWKFYNKYAAACGVLTITSLFGNFEGEILHGGRYPQVRYGYYCYPKMARNQYEGFPESEKVPASPSSDGVSQISPWQRRQPGDDEFDGAFGRHLRPRMLCVISEDGRPASAPGYNVVNVDVENFSGEYVFVSYTRLQFQTYTSQQIDGWKPPEGKNPQQINQWHRENRQRKRMHAGDLDQLYHIGFKAAVNAKVNAFWIDVLCMDSEAVLLDAHRICDVARGANRMVIALKQDIQSRIQGRIQENPASVQPQSIDQSLCQWASRLWTLPELLLAPTVPGFEIWIASKSLLPCETIPKRNMAERAYRKDGMLVRQLVDHFESNLHMTQSELLTTGLQCLMERAQETKPYTPADPIYALMTLARRRPPPLEKKSLFEAFAQLSLMNDSDKLLERLICMLPPRRGEAWFNVRDFWNVNLWDIFPTCQVAAIAEDVVLRDGSHGATIILDGACGASIEWKELPQVAFLKRKTIWRSIGSFLVRFAPGWLISSIITLVSVGKPTKVLDHFGPDAFGFDTVPVYKTYVNPLVALGIVLFLIAFFSVVTLPAVMRNLYGGKFWSTQALLIGMEGVPEELDLLEKKLFGFGDGRLRWSACSSTLSRHRPKARGPRLKGECEAVKPLLDDVDDGENYDYETGQRLDPDRVFTLVDTYSMTVTAFRAVHPPSVALICGHEGGMQRAVLCSYYYKTQTFHRETVIRMPTKVLDRIDRVNKFRFSLESMALRAKSC